MPSSFVHDAQVLDGNSGFEFESDSFRVLRDIASGRTWTLTHKQKPSRPRTSGMHVFSFESSALTAFSSHISARDQCAGSLELRIDSAIWSTGETNTEDVHDPFVRELALAVLNGFCSIRPNDYTLHCIIKMLCARLQELYATRVNKNDRQFEDWQLSVLAEVLEAGRDGYVEVSDVAGKCGLSICHFSRLFKATYGMPLHRYLVRTRINDAKTRLARTCDPISQIALDCGFADQSSFTRRFTAVAGVSPALWRRRGSPKACESARAEDLRNSERLDRAS